MRFDRSSRPWVSVLVLSLLAALVAGCGAAPGTPAQSDPCSRIVTRVYDIRPLIISIWGTREETVRGIVGLLKRSVDQDGWDSADGTRTIEEKDGRLTVTQTEFYQGQIKELIRQLRESKSLSVKADLDLLYVPPDEQKGVAEWLRKAGIPAPRVGSNSIIRDSNHASGFLAYARARVGIEHTAWSHLGYAYETIEIPRGFLPGSFVPPAAGGKKPDRLTLEVEPSADRRYITASLGPQAFTELPGVIIREPGQSVSVPDEAFALFAIPAEPQGAAHKGEPRTRPAAKPGGTLYLLVFLKLCIESEEENKAFPP